MKKFKFLRCITYLIACLAIMNWEALTGITATALAVKPNRNKSPIAYATADPLMGDIPLTVQFTGSTSTDPDGIIISYYWDFGNGNTSIEADPIYIYQDTGTYGVTLTVTDNENATGEDFIEVTASPQIPKKMRFQGRLKDNNTETNLNGTFNIIFRLYDVAIGGNPLWEETQENNINEGEMDVVLGSSEEINLQFDKQYYLGVEVEQDGEMVPRFEMTSVPYAINSGR